MCARMRVCALSAVYSNNSEERCVLISLGFEAKEAGRRFHLSCIYSKMYLNVEGTPWVFACRGHAIFMHPSRGVGTIRDFVPSPLLRDTRHSTKP